MALPYFNHPQRSQGQRGSGPAFNQNAGFLPSQTTYGSGPKNIRNGTENPRFQNQNHGRGRRGRNRRTQQRNGGNGNFSGAPDFDRNGNDQNWPVDHRQQTFNHQVRDQSQNSHFQSPLGQPHWDQQNSNQGRRSNGGNRHRNYNDPNNGSFNLQENWQPHNKDNRGRNNRQASNYHAHPSFHSKGIESDLSEIIASASYSQAPLVPFGMLQFIHKVSFSLMISQKDNN